MSLRWPRPISRGPINNTANIVFIKTNEIKVWGCILCTFVFGNVMTSKVVFSPKVVFSTALTAFGLPNFGRLTKNKIFNTT